VISEDKPVEECRPASDTNAAETAEEPEQKTKRWLIFADRGGICGPVVEALRARGDTCSLLFAGSPPARETDNGRAMMATSPDDLKRLVLELKDGGRLPGAGVPGGVLHFWNLDAPEAATMTATELEAFQPFALYSIVALVQAWAAEA